MICCGYTALYEWRITHREFEQNAPDVKGGRRGRPGIRRTDVDLAAGRRLGRAREERDLQRPASSGRRAAPRSLPICAARKHNLPWIFLSSRNPAPSTNLPLFGCRGARARRPWARPCAYVAPQQRPRSRRQRLRCMSTPRLAWTPRHLSHRVVHPHLSQAL